MSKIIYFEQHRPVLLTRVTDADLFLDAYVDSEVYSYAKHTRIEFHPSV